jgi:hypothetical protein
VLPEIEVIVRESKDYVVVEKTGLAAEVAEALVETPERPSSSAS